MEAIFPGYTLFVGVIASLLLISGAAPCCWSHACTSPLAAGFVGCCRATAPAATSSHSSINDASFDCMGNCTEASPRDFITEASVHVDSAKNIASSDPGPIGLPEFSNPAIHRNDTPTISLQGSDLVLRNCSLLA